MKKLFALLILVSAATFSSCESGSENGSEEYLPDGKRRCAAITQDGHQCKRAAEEGSIYCWQHKK